MSGTRKLEKFELDSLVTPPRESGMRKLESVLTPIAEISPFVLDASRRSVIDAVEAAGVEAPLATPPPSTIEINDTPPPAATTARRSSGPAALVIDDGPPPPSSKRTIDREPIAHTLRTQLAQKFTTLADEVTAAFAEFHIGAGAWTAELTAPVGMSTKGGKHSLQHLRLRPTRQGHAVLVGGLVNPVEMTAQLRDYDHMVLLYRARFGRTLEITAAEWEQFLRKAEVVLRDEKIGTSRVAAPHDVVALARKASAGIWNQKVAVGTLATVLVAASIVVSRVIAALWP